MTAIPLGVGAYKRAFAGSPEVVLLNRYMEKSPTNQREHMTLISRPGTNLLVTPAGGKIRGTFAKPGTFNGDFFSVSGANFYRYGVSAGPLTQVTGAIGGSGYVYVTWMKGIGYEYLFISDGNSLQFYCTRARGVLTLTLNSPDNNITNQVIQINGTYYSWATNVNPATTPDGTSAHPYLALLGTASPGNTADNQSLQNMVKMINFSGVQGGDFSQSVPQANQFVTATSNDTTLTLTATPDGTAGNAISTTVFSGSYLAWGAATLTGGGNQALQPVPIPDDQSPLALASVSSYVLVSISGTNKFYWINPGETTIDPLNFASKESNPDNIIDMHTVGDQVLITGDGSAENWYATGQLDAPFAPQEGRVYRRGSLSGTPVVVKDSVILVGDDGVVYEIGYQFGTTATWGVHRISTHGIEERIRTAIRRLQGLTP